MATSSGRCWRDLRQKHCGQKNEDTDFGFFGFQDSKELGSHFSVYHLSVVCLRPLTTEVKPCPVVPSAAARTPPRLSLRRRVGSKWYRVDLTFFHRRLRCLVILDLKLGTLDHADAGQMHLYLSYAAEHWTHEAENPPVGIIRCSAADAALARYTLDTLPNKVMAREPERSGDRLPQAARRVSAANQYQLALPAVKKLEAELAATRKRLERTPKLNPYG